MNHKSFYPLLEKQIELDTKKKIRHIRLDDELFIFQIPKIIKDTMGFTLLSQDNKLIGYITTVSQNNKKEINKHAHTQIQIKEDIADYLIQFSEKLLTEKSLWHYISEKSPVCGKDTRTIKRIFKEILREFHVVSDCNNPESEEYYWVDSFIDKYCPGIVKFSNFNDFKDNDPERLQEQFDNKTLIIK